jgi:hypothetical protein
MTLAVGAGAVTICASSTLKNERRRKGRRNADSRGFCGYSKRCLSDSALIYLNKSGLTLLQDANQVRLTCGEQKSFPRKCAICLHNFGSVSV